MTGALTASHCCSPKAHKRLPTLLWRSMTHDQGADMTDHAHVTLKTNIPVFLCDPHSPWPRGSNENTNRLLRQYFPTGTDLSVHSQADLDAVATKLNGRPQRNPRLAHPHRSPQRVSTSNNALTS
jgi:transposase, IS30 family